MAMNLIQNIYSSLTDPNLLAFFVWSNNFHVCGMVHMDHLCNVEVFASNL